MFDFFLSYRRSDQAVGRALASELQARGATVWWDERIEGGEDWRDAIVENLEKSRALIILFSEDCNASKQLRKELALADALDKTIIPVLIEDTKPKGHYLYELAALNWLQIHPDPMTRVGQLSERLIAEIGDVAVPPPVFAPEPIDADAAAEPETGAPPPPAARAAAPAKARTASTLKAARKQTKSRRNFLPFKWYEIGIAVAVGLLALFGGLTDVNPERIVTPQTLALDFVMVTLVILIVIAILVFPFRYFFRQLRARQALFYFLASVWGLSIPLGTLSALHPQIVEEGTGLGGNIALYIFVWMLISLGLSIVAFAIYGLLNFQRAVRHLKKNTEVIEAA